LKCGITRLDSWWGKGLPSQQSLAVMRVGTAAMELKTVHTSMGGSRLELWSMDEKSKPEKLH